MCVNLASAAMANGVEAGGNLQAFGNGLNVLQSIAVGDAQRSAANSQADIIMTGANMRARSIRRQAQQDLGTARAAAAASGVKVSGSSVMAAENDIVRYSEQDALTVLLNGQTEATQVREKGRQAMMASFSKGADSLIHGLDAWQRTRRRPGLRANDPYRIPGYVGGSEGE